MKKQAFIVIIVGTLVACLGLYFAIYDANHKIPIPWWSFFLFFLGIAIIPIGYALLKVKKPKIHKIEEPEVVILPKEDKRTKGK